MPKRYGGIGTESACHQRSLTGENGVSQGLSSQAKCPTRQDIAPFNVKMLDGGCIPIVMYQSFFGLDDINRHSLGVRARRRTNDPAKGRAKRSN